MARKVTGKRSVGRNGSVRVHGKASNGEGSVYLDADGSWRATFVAPGSARPKRVRGKTREEAIARRAVKLEELSQIQSSTFHREATVAELAAAGVASLLVPFPHAVDDHQTSNARFLSGAGAAILLPQEQMTPQHLAEIRKLSRPQLTQMAEKARELARPDATAEVAQACAQLARKGKPE